MKVTVQTFDFEGKPLGDPYERDLSAFDNPRRHLAIGASWTMETSIGRVEFQVASVEERDGETLLRLEAVEFL